MEKEQKKKLYKMGLPIIMGTILLLGVSYAWLSLTLNGTKTNVLKAGTLSLTLTDTATNGINMEGTVPMLDEVGVTTSPYTFTLKNNGTIDSEYTIYLDDVALNSGETKLPDTVIKYNLVKDNVSMSTALLNTIGSNPNRILDSGVIKPNETYTYDLRLWLDENMTSTDSGKVFKGKIRVVAEQIKEKAPTDPSCFTFDSNTGTITGYNCHSYQDNGYPIIRDVVIPSSINGVTVEKINLDVYEGNWCSSYGSTSITFPNTITEIPDGFCGKAYGDYSSDLQSVVIPEGITKIGEGAFANGKITELKLPSTLQTIALYAFYNNQITKLVIPEKVTRIGESAFSMNSINQLTFKNTTIPIYMEGYVFLGNNLSEVTIPESITDLGASSIFGYNQLTSIKLPNTLKTIGSEAFINNQLTSVTIPSSVTFLDGNAFANNQLTSVIIKGKSSTADFSNYAPDAFGWASGYSDANITWQP